MKIKLIALIIFLGVISFLTFFKNNGIKAPVAEKKPQSLDDLFMVSSAKGKSIVEEFVHKINSNDLEVENPIKSTFTDAFKPWNKLKLSLSKKNHRREIVQELISREGVVDFSSKILIDKNLAVETFGKNQALARIISIEVLKEEARNGNSEPIVRTLNQLNITFSEAEPDIGQRQDIEDLLTGYFEISLPDFPEGLDSGLKDINLSQNLIPIFMAAVLNNSGKRHYDEAMKILKNYSDS